MNKVEPFWKLYGETPKQALERFRVSYGVEDSIPLSYAGRLDPLAEGVLLVLVGEGNKERERYLNLPKTYEYELVFGIETDTHDVLGIPRVRDMSMVEGKAVEEWLQGTKGDIVQTYPAFSSKPFKGMPLFMHAKAGTVSNDELPEHSVTVYSHTLIDMSVVGGDMILSKALHATGMVSGEFRQNLIAEKWNELAPVISHKNFSIARIQLTCGSGTYVRAFARDIGEALGVGAFAFRIVRTAVGEYTVR